MKTQKTILSLLFSFILLGFSGCSEDEPVTPTEKLTKITLSTESDVSKLTEGAKVKFVVKDDKNNVFTKAKIYVADKEIEGMEHTFAKAGDFKVYAKYGDLKSNEITVKVKGKDTPTAESKLTVSAEGDISKLTEGAKVKFVVKDDKNKIVTNAEVYVDGTKITGMEHTFAKAGDFKVYAKQGDLKSNEITIKVKEKDTPVTGGYVLSIKGGKTTIKQGESVEFKLVDPKGNDVKLGEGLEINIKGITVLIFEKTAEPYTFKNPGVYEIQAKIFTTNDQSGKHVKSNIVKLTVESDGQARSYTPKVFAHRFTGTWCQYCPHIALTVKELKKLYPKNLIEVAIHGNSTKDGTDPFAYSKIGDFKVKEYPTLWLDYNKELGENVYDVEDGKKALKELATVNRALGLAINYDLANNKVTVKVGYDKAFPNSKLVVFLVEDGLIADQSNGSDKDKYSPAYQKGNPIKNYVHNSVLRYSLTNTQGDAIPDAEVKNNLYSREFDLSGATSSAKDINKTRVIAYVIDSNGRVANAQVAKVNVNQDFDFD